MFTKRAIFKCVSKIIQDWYCFVLLCSVIGPALFGSLIVLTFSPHWFFNVFPFLLIGCCNYFGFGSTTLDRRALLLISGYLTKSIAQRNYTRPISHSSLAMVLWYGNKHNLYNMITIKNPLHPLSRIITKSLRYRNKLCEEINMKKRTYKEIIIEIFRLKKLMPVNFKTFKKTTPLKSTA